MPNRFVFLLLQKGTNHNLLEILGALLKGTLVKYWSYFCAATFLILSFDGSVVAYKIFSAVLFQVLCGSVSGKQKNQTNSVL